MSVSVHASYRYDVFLSHSSADKPFVEAVALRLREEGLRPFLDRWHLIPGERWQEDLETALEASATCAVFIGDGPITPWQNEEMRAALDGRTRSQVLRVIPVLLPGSNPLNKASFPPFLRRFSWVDFRRGLNDERQYRRLVSGIRGEMPGADGELPSYVLEQLLSDDSEDRRASAEFIGELGLPATLSIIEGRYDEEEDPTVRHWLALAVGEIGGEAAIALLGRLRDRESDPFACLGIETALKGGAS